MRGERPGLEAWEPPAPGVTWAGIARAKVNLFLRVLGREESGYHQIETCFQALRLADTVSLEVTNGGATHLDLEGVPEGALGPAGENLAVRAADQFRRALGEAGSPYGLDIRVTKRVPHGAGLGGGSSDAAAVLRGLNEIWGEPFSIPELMRLGGDLGADLPFFVAAIPRADGAGRGDRLLPLPSLPERPVLLLLPSERISTKWAYEMLASRRAGSGSPDRPDLPAVGTAWSEVAAVAENDFEEVLFPLRPDLARLKRELVATGAAPALLSGSGSSLFGVFEDERAMERASEQLLASVPEARVVPTRTVGPDRDELAAR